MNTSHKHTHILFILAALVLMAAAALAQPVGNVNVLGPARSVNQSQDAKAGSILVFPFYGSDGTAANDTSLTITNVGPLGYPGAPVANFNAGAAGFPTDILNNLNVHLFWLDGTSCSQADGYVCFTKFQSWTFKASEWDPVTARGILIAVAVDPAGYPIAYNGLIGNAYVNCNVTQGGITERWLGNYGAEAFAGVGRLRAPVPAGQAYFYTTAANPGNGNTTATLQFNNAPFLAVDPLGPTGYDAGSAAYAAEFRSPADLQGQTVLTVSLQGTIGGALTGNGVENNSIAAIYRNDEKIFSWTGPGDSCQSLLRITATNPRIVGGLGLQIGTGKTGTMVWTTLHNSVGLFITPQAGNNNWVGIRPLHKRNVPSAALLGTSALVMPVFMPTCVL